MHARVLCDCVSECWSVRVRGGADEQSEVEQNVVKLLGFIEGGALKLNP